MKRPTLLCVDDEPSVLDLLSRTFNRQAQVLVASSGAEALEILESRSVDLLITDQKMPNMTGIELVGAARAKGIEVTTILLTAYTSPVDLIAAINEANVYRYVTKPWDVNDLQLTVKSALELGSLRREKDRLLDSLRKRIEALNVMYEVSRRSSGDAWSLEAIVDRLLETVGRVLPHDCSAVLIETGEGHSASLRIRCQVVLGETALLDLKESVLSAHQKAAGVALTEDRVITNVSGQGTSLSGGVSSFPAALSVPLVSSNQVVGTLSIFSSVADAYSLDDGELLDLLVNQTTDAITQVRAAEREARLRLEQVVETMNDGVLLASDKGVVLVANGAARAMLGAGEGPITLAHLTAKLGLSPFEMVRGLEGGTGKRFLEELKLEGRSIQLVASPVASAGPRLKGVLLVMHDVTARKQLERRKDEFVGVVSHELRSPLTAIAGALDLVLNNFAGDVNSKQRRFLDMARESTEKLNALVDDLLDLSKAAEGRLKMAFELVRIDELVRRAVEKYGPAMQEKDITAVCEVPPDSLKGSADPNRITQVLNNLLTNAVKFTPKGGAVRVSLNATPVAPGLVTLTVWNSGDPIPEPDLERIFDRFEQARTPKNRGVPGTGLGLSISRSIVHAHGGRVWAEPCLDGARFVVVLPTEPPKKAPDLEAPTGTPRATVLVVEDESTVALPLKAVLLNARLRVVVAANADEALSAARTHRPEVILLDLHLPDVDGLRLLEIFRHAPDTARSKILAVSGSELGEEAMRAGAVAFLRKPLAAEPLLAAIDSAFERRVEGRGSVLVVDDDAQISAISAEVLRNLGFVVEQAGTLAEARAKLDSLRPELLLLDVQLPDGDGFEFFEEIKAERAASPVSVVFASALSDTSSKVKALKLGGDDYITKPFDARELGARVESVLRRRNSDGLVSPSTGLPGSLAVEREVERRVAAKEPFAFCYLDLDNLKAYNDYYGFAKADGVVRQTADLLREILSRPGQGAFLGHLAGDDFVFIAPPAEADQLCRRILESFDRVIPLYYDRADRERGYIEADDRLGERRRYPIMSASIVAVMSDGALPHSDLARRAAELKKRAKAVAGSVYLRSDREAPVLRLVQGQ